MFSSSYSFKKWLRFERKTYEQCFQKQKALQGFFSPGADTFLEGISPQRGGGQNIFSPGADLRP